MTRLPFRGQTPSFPRTAPRPVPSPLPGFQGKGLAGYVPAPVKRLASTRLGQAILRPANLRGAHAGLFISSLALEWAVTRANALLILYLNGLTMLRTCSRKGMDTFTIAATAGPCLTSTGGGLRLSQLGAVVAAASPTDVIKMLGVDVITPFLAVFYIESRTYSIAAIPANASARPRPFYGPMRFPFAPPRIGSVARPREVPFNVRPWPVWASAVPVGAGVSGGSSSTNTTLGSGAATSVAHPGRSFDFIVRPGAQTRTGRGARAITRAPPAPRTKETKVGANTVAGQMFFALMRAKEVVSEVGDFVEALFRALPRATQKRYAKDMGSMGLALWENWDRFDFKLAFRNLLANHLEDEIIGRTFFPARAATRNRMFGNRMGSTGPVNNPFFEAYTQRVNAFADATVNPWLGYGTRAEHRLDREARLERDRASAARRRQRALTTRGA